MFVVIWCVFLSLLCAQFPLSDVECVMSKVKETVAGKRLNELMSYGALEFNDFRHMMHNICPALCDQEIITLAR